MERSEFLAPLLFYDSLNKFQIEYLPKHDILKSSFWEVSTMKEKFYGIRTSIIIMILGIFLSSIFQFCNFVCLSKKFTDYLVMLFGGAAASALVTLIIYLSEYISIKTATLENYWHIQYSLLNNFLKIKYYDFHIPKELLQKYYSEQIHNKQVDNLISQLPSGIAIPDSPHFKYKDEALMEWCQFISNDFIYLKDNISAKEFQKLLTNTVIDSAKKYLEDIEKTIESYCSLAACSYSTSENAIGEIYFLLNKKARKKIFSEIHEPMRKYLNNVKEISYHFKLYLSGESKNIPMVLEFINTLQNDFFVVETTKDETGISTLVYNDLGVKRYILFER